ncbi:hypothetical protein AB0758_47065 [Tolypothrix bouteillei VB521301_2]|uniref:M10 family metallopeptidase C-terminal domain-containing protein n=1 Tax=Tolypothrix bouteillei TaxID=1246981 RepID=UPI0038B4749E
MVLVKDLSIEDFSVYTYRDASASSNGSFDVQLNVLEFGEVSLSLYNVNALTLFPEGAEAKAISNFSSNLLFKGVTIIGDKAKSENWQIQLEWDNGKTVPVFPSLGGGITQGNDTGNDLRASANVSSGVLFFGEAGDDKITGTQYDDILVGGKGNDILTGDKGKDDFVLDSISTDTITNFVSGEDRLVLSKSEFLLESLSFAVVDSEQLAATVDAKITYMPSLGALYWNQNGSVNGFGNGRQIASLPVGTQLTSNDFLLRA